MILQLFKPNFVQINFTSEKKLYGKAMYIVNNLLYKNLTLAFEN